MSFVLMDGQIDEGKKTWASEEKKIDVDEKQTARREGKLLAGS